MLTRLAGAFFSMVLSSRNAPIELISTSQPTAPENAPQSVTRGVSNTSEASPTSGALTRNCVAVPVRTSMSPANRFW